MMLKSASKCSHSKTDLTAMPYGVLFRLARSKCGDPQDLLRYSAECERLLAL